ncbi:MAG: hypothetical protein AAF789_03590 [Bacteroidota bacterium]
MEILELAGITTTFVIVVFEKTVGELVDENYIYARALHFLGIDFLNCSNVKLRDLCLSMGIDRKLLIKSFYSFDSTDRLSFKELEKYPIPLLLEYLRYSHHQFIKEKLPYIVEIANKTNEQQVLQVMLPEFVEDFIKHIYEEEDHTFRYIQLLTDINAGKIAAPFSKLSSFGVSFSLQKEVAEHGEEDELAAIRELILSIEPNSLEERVIVAEMKAFDREMFYHASIENDLLFPKALQLESEVKKQINRLAAQN